MKKSKARNEGLTVQRPKLRKKPKRLPRSPVTTPLKRRLPAGAPILRRESRRQTLAAGILQGQTVTELAKRERVSRTYASREANAPETRLLMAELLGQHRRKVSRLVGKALIRIDHALDAHATEIVVGDQTRKKGKDGTFKDVRTYRSVLAGVDHYARMTGAKRLLEMIQAARTDAQPEQVGTITWEMFLRLREEVLPACPK